MKLTNILHVFACIFMIQLAVQAQSNVQPVSIITQRAEYVPNAPRIEYERFYSNSQGRLPEMPKSYGEKKTNSVPISQATTPVSKIGETNGFAPIINERFIANNLYGYYPSDNGIAISNGGFIISTDYSTVEFYTENGVNGTFIQKYEWNVFYSAVPGITTDFFDPRIIYDNVADRFILVQLNGRNSAVSNVLVSFSKNNHPSDISDWYQYVLPATAYHSSMWFDYPNIGISDEDLFITGIMFTNDANPACNVNTSIPAGNKIFQINKGEGYGGLPLSNKLEWNDLPDANNNIPLGMVPVTYGQSGAFGPGIYFVYTNLYGASAIYYSRIIDGAATGAYWGGSFKVLTPTYIPAGNCTQTDPLGGQNPNRLDGGDNRVQNAFFLNNKIHFVFTEQGAAPSNQLGAISYNIIDLSATPVTNTRNILDLSTQNQACAYPSIASYGVNQLDESVIIGFLRSGDNMYAQVAALSFEANSFTPQIQIPIVQQGLGVVNLECDNAANICCNVHFERWGDYTGIQRRYNQHRVWMVGAYAFGTTPNAGGSTNGWNAYVAEVGDGSSIGVEALPQASQISVYPNPANGNITIVLDGLLGNEPYEVTIFDITGRSVQKNILQNVQNMNTFVIETDALPSGIYHLSIQTNNYSIYHEKLAIVH